jgi:hypothetical protein
MNDIALDDQILVDKFGRKAVVCLNTADFGCGENDILGAFSLEECRHRLLTGKIQPVYLRQQQISVSTGTQSSHQRRADQTVGTGNKYFCICFHVGLTILVSSQINVIKRVFITLCVICRQADIDFYATSDLILSRKTASIAKTTH